KTDLSGVSSRVGPFVFDVKHRRHFISVSRRKTTRREIDISDQIHIGKRQTLLLSAPDQLRPIYLKIIDIDQILIIISTPHIILAAQFPPGTTTHTQGKMRKDLLQISRHGWQQSHLRQILGYHSGMMRNRTFYDHFKIGNERNQFYLQLPPYIRDR